MKTDSTIVKEKSFSSPVLMITVLAFLFVLSTGTVQAATTRYVCSDGGCGGYTTISTAITAASAGDTIIVYNNGTQYVGNNLYINKQITLTGIGTPIINASSGTLYGIEIATNSVTVTGFNIIKYSGSFSGAIYIYSGSNNVISNNIISNGNNNRVGIYVGGAPSAVTSNTITNNTILNYNYGLEIYVNPSSNNIINNNLSNNNYGIWFNCGNSAKPCTSNVFYNNYFNNNNNLNFQSPFYGSAIWNTTKTSGTKIIGGPFLGGNYWANPGGTGFSQTCTPTGTGFCSSPFNTGQGNDNLPLNSTIYPPPAVITSLHNTSYSPYYINWAWTDPMDATFASVNVYMDGVYQASVPKGTQYFNATNLRSSTSHTISTQTVSTGGLVNTTSVSDTETTATRIVTVCPNPPGGCDYTSIQAAVNGINPGDTIQIESGTYTENVNVNIPAILTAINTGTGTPIIQPSISSNPVITLSNSSITIQGFQITSPGAGGRDIYITGGVSGNLITNNIISIGINGQDAIYVNDLSWPWDTGGDTISNNVISVSASNVQSGITVLNDGNTITGNTISGAEYGIQLRSLSNTLNNNTISGSFYYSIYDNLFATEAKSNTIYNNYFNSTNNIGYGSLIGTLNFNIAQTAGPNIVGGPYIGGNYWANPSGTGFSQNRISCSPGANEFCTQSYDANYPGIYDYLPLTTLSNQQTTTTTVSSSSNPSVYGQSITFTATIVPPSGSIPDDETVTFEDGSNIIGTALTSSGRATFSTSSLSAGSHTISTVYVGDADFLSSTDSMTQQVNQSTPTISWNNPADITYGTPLNGTQLDATTSVPGTFAYDPAAGTIIGAGEYQPLYAVFTPFDTTNYSGTTANVTINVSQANTIITWNNPSDIVYGTPLSSIQLNASATDPTDAAVQGDFYYNPPAGTILGAGTWTLIAIFTANDSTNYTNPSAAVIINVIASHPQNSNLINTPAGHGKYISGVFDAGKNVTFSSIQLTGRGISNQVDIYTAYSPDNRTWFNWTQTSGNGDVYSIPSGEYGRYLEYMIIAPYGTKISNVTISYIVSPNGIIYIE